MMRVDSFAFRYSYWGYKAADLPSLRQRDNANAQCAPLDVCIKGQCILNCGQDGTQVCNGLCVNLQTDQTFCGACNFEVGGHVPSASVLHLES